MNETPKLIIFKVKMKPSANKKDVIVDHPEREMRASYISLNCLGHGSTMAAEDIESIEIIG